MMDAVELPLPTAFPISEFMGSEGFVGAAGVKDPRSGYSDSVSVVVTPFISDRVSFNTESVRKGILKVELGIHDNLLLNSPKEHVFIEVSNEISFPSVLVSDNKQIRKYGKNSRSNSYGMKRLRKAQSEDVKTKDEKNQVIKQKNANIRRLDKKNFKVPIKSKCDALSARTGQITLNSADPMNNIFGPYGMKKDDYTFVDLEEEYPLDTILKENASCFLSSQPKGKKFRNTTEEIMQSINMACAIFDMRKPASTSVDDDVSVKNCTESSEVSVLCTDSFSIQKTIDPCDKTNTSIGIADFPLHQPKDILEHLALSRQQNLESLLFDVDMAGTSTSKNIGKSMSRMQYFPWSHSSGGHCRTNLDSTNLSVRNTCQGKWIKLGNKILTTGDNNDFIKDFESLIYSTGLVSSEDPKSKYMLNTYSEYESSGFPQHEEAPLPSKMNSEDSSALQAVNSPRAVAAAETLLELASHYSLTQSPQKTARWSKKLPEKVIKISKPMFVGRNMELSTRSEAKPNMKGEIESKELKFCMEQKQEYGLATAISRGPLNWSTLGCSRSAPNRPLISETKHLNAKVQPSSISWSTQNSTKN